MVEGTEGEGLGKQTKDLRKVGIANCDEIGGCQNPEGEIGYYRDFDEDPHDRNKKQHDRVLPA
jgi:hypothetical protein